jgi:hypothetical protein
MNLKPFLRLRKMFDKGPAMRLPTQVRLERAFDEQKDAAE